MKGVKIVDNIERLVRERRSFRTFDGREVTAEDREKLCGIMGKENKSLNKV